MFDLFYSNLAVVIDAACGASIVGNIFAHNPGSWETYLLCLLFLTGLSYVGLKMIEKRFVALPCRTLISLAAISTLFGLLSFCSGGGRGKSLVWIKAAGGFAGQLLPITDRTAWGKTNPGIEIHATVNDDPQWMWRAMAELPDSMKPYGGSISILLTQPEWDVFDKYRRLYSGADGVDVRFLAEREAGADIIHQLTLNLIARPEQRQWESFNLKVPPGSKRLWVEALPGRVGSNNWHDRVFLTVKQMQTSAEEISKYLTALTLVVLLYLSGLVICSYGRLLTIVLPSGVVIKVLYSGIALFLLLVGARAYTTDLSSRPPEDVVSYSLLMAYPDAAYVGTLAGICLFLLFVFRSTARGQVFIFSSYILVCSISLSLGIVNSEMLRLLGGPLNYQWLYYSDFLSGQTARASLLAYLHASLPLLGTLIIANVTFVSIVAVLKRRAEHRSQEAQQTYLGAAAILLFGIYAISPTSSVHTSDYDSMKLANPVVAFLGSVITASQGPRLFSMRTSIGAKDFEPVPRLSVHIEDRHDSKVSPIRNIVLFVLESGGAEYIYNEKFKIPEIVPEIKRYRRQAATFTNIYAHVPASNKSLVSILSSVYPMISYRSLTQELPRARLISLSADLKRRGYRTGFFSSADFRFQRGDEFLSYQQFETIIDYNNLKCARTEFRNSSADWPFQNSFEDECLLAPFTDWVSKDSSHGFFAVLWPDQMHHPYSVIGPEVNFGAASEEFNRYLNALHQTDRLLGEVLRWLDSRGILDSTLVVVVGDHGEAFGQHGQFIHASHLYEENIHVPLMLINRRVFNGQQYDTIGGLVDVAPTVMDLLDLPFVPGWQGRSLFDGSRSARTYFFAPYSRFLFGLREGSLKLIIDAAANRSEVYDLKTDPEEKTNLSSAYPEFVRTGEQRIAAWAQYQNRMYKHLFAEKEPKM